MAKKQRAFDAQGKPASVEYSNRLDDLKAASRVVGTTDRSQLDWLVRFAAEDPTSWQSATVAARGDCLLALAKGGYPANLIGGVALPEPPTRSEVLSLQLDLKRTLRSLLHESAVGVPVWFPAEPQSLTGLMRCSAVGEKPAIFGAPYRPESLRAAVFQRLRDLVFRVGDRLIACPLCGDGLVAVRKQKFCSEEHAQKFRNENRSSGGGHGRQTRKG